jgi:hypothetical protein
MFFNIQNKKYLSTEQLRTRVFINAYYIIQKYPLHASDMLLETYLMQRYNTSLKNMCIKLLLNLTMHKDEKGNLVLLFKDNYYDTIASLITYGNGAIPGSKILQIALQ